MPDTSGGERFRGSSEIPLTDQGVAAARELAMGLAKRGGLSEIHTSSLGRTVHTAKILNQYTHAPIVDVTDRLHPWHLGALEGQKITPELLDLQRKLTTDLPDEAVPGRGPLSTADGESFNAFKDRTLSKLKELIQAHISQPDKAIGVVTHYRVKKLLDSWMRAGMPADGTVDTQEMVQPAPDNKPGGIEMFRHDPYSGPAMYDVDLDSPARLQGGLYLIRHEKTPWNASQGS